MKKVRRAAAGSGLIALALAAGVVGSLAAQEKPDQQVSVIRVANGGSYLGVYISEVDAEDRTRLNLREERGVLITEVSEDGPARSAGLMADDVVVSWNGEPVEGTAQLRRLLRETPPGRSVELGVVRGSSERTFDVTLGEGRAVARSGVWNEDAARRLREKMRKHREDLGETRVMLRSLPHARYMAFGGGRLGVSIQSLGEQLADYFGLDDRKGVLITSVREESAAADAGLRAGDVILAVGGTATEDPSDVARLVHEADPGPVAVRILRDRREQTINVELPEAHGKTEPGELHGLFFGPGDFGFTPFDFDVELETLPHLERLEIDIPDLAPVFESLEPVWEGLIEAREATALGGTSAELKAL